MRVCARAFVQRALYQVSFGFVLGLFWLCIRSLLTRVRVCARAFVRIFMQVCIRSLLAMY